MAIQKQWFTLKELSEKWQCSISSLVHLGITCELDISIDWVVLRQEANNFIVEFTEIIDMYYCEQAKQDRKLTSPIPSPDYKQNPLLRLAKLSSDDIAIINKHGSVPIHQAFLSEFEYLDVYCDNDIEALQNPLISIEDLVVTSEQIERYKHTIEDRVCSQKNNNTDQNKSSREIQNDEKLLALFINTLANKENGKRLYHGNNLSANQITNLLEENIPEGMSDDGISSETIRKKISKPIKLLNPHNY